MAGTRRFIYFVFLISLFRTVWTFHNTKCEFNLHPDTRDIANTSYVSLVRSVKLDSGTTYRYIFKEPQSKSAPWLLFLHGFPSSSYDWRHQVEHFSKHGYGVIAPDLLGYGGTDNPANLTRFSLKNMVAEVNSLLDCERVDTVFAIGHDFGSLLLSRLINYTPDRLQAVIFLDIGYIAPPLPLDLAGIEALNNATLAEFGYPIFGYWYFMNEDDVAPIMDAHLDSGYSLMYTYDEAYTQEYFALVGAFKQWLLANRMAPFGEYVDNETMDIFNNIVTLSGGYDGPVKWYKSCMRDINKADEEAIPIAAAKIHQPVLLITAADDRVGVAALQVNFTTPYASNIRIKSLDSGHFVQLQKPVEVNAEITVFIRDVLKNTTYGMV